MAFGPDKGLSSEAVLALSKSGMFDQPMYDLMPLIVSLYVCSSDGVWSGSVAVRSCSSDNSPSSAYRSLVVGQRSHYQQESLGWNTVLSLQRRRASISGNCSFWSVGMRSTDMRLAGGQMPGGRGFSTSVSRRFRSVPVRTAGLMLASRGVSTAWEMEILKTVGL